jgi:hypothetical protein
MAVERARFTPRDVKPSNVMITLYDGKPVPKVIDSSDRHSFLALIFKFQSQLISLLTREGVLQQHIHIHCNSSCHSLPLP